MIKAHLGIPFWGDNPHRLRSFGFVSEMMQKMWQWNSATIGVPGIKPSYHTRGGSRNYIVREAMAAGADVVVLCDADTYPEQGALLQSIREAYVDGGLHFSFDRFRAFNERGTDLLLGGNPTGAYAELESECLGSLGGCMAIRPDEWARAGWSPELEGWGFEDVIFAVQARTLLDHDNKWHPGQISHLWHPTTWKFGTPEYAHNIGVCKRFEAASWDKPAIRALIEEYNPRDASEPS